MDQRCFFCLLLRALCIGTAQCRKVIYGITFWIGAFSCAQAQQPQAFFGGPCWLGTIEGSACVMGQVLGQRPVPVHLKELVAGAARLAGDGFPDFPVLVDVEASRAGSESAGLLPVTPRTPGYLYIESIGAYGGAVRWAILGQPESAQRELESAARHRARERAGIGVSRKTDPQRDMLEHDVHAGVVSYLSGARAEGLRLFMSGARALPSSNSNNASGGMTSDEALRLWLGATWDLAPVFAIASTLDDPAARWHLLQALTIATLVPRQANDAARVVDSARLMAVRSGDVSLAMWSVRAAAGSCRAQMKSIDALTGQTVVIPNRSGMGTAVRRMDPEGAENLEAALQDLFAAWRDHYCERTVPHRHLALTAAWVHAHAALSDVKKRLRVPDDLLRYVVLGRSANFLAEVAADLRSPARVRDAFSLSPSISFNVATPMYLGFMGVGAEAIDWALSTRINQAQPVQSTFAALVAAGAALGHQYVGPGRSTVLSEGIAGNHQACGVPVFSTGGMYTQVNLTKLSRPSRPSSCAKQLVELTDRAAGLDQAMAGERTAYCQFLKAQTRSSLSSMLMRNKASGLQDEAAKELLGLLPDVAEMTQPKKPIVTEMIRATRNAVRLDAALQAFQLGSFWVKLIDASLYAGTYAIDEVTYAQQLSEYSRSRQATEAAMKALAKAQATVTGECLEVK